MKFKLSVTGGLGGEAGLKQRGGGRMAGEKKCLGF